MPAKTIDSYKDTLYAVLDIFNPKTVLEYGPGESTMAMLLCRSIEYIRCIEHDSYWLEKFKSYGLKVDLVFQPDIEKYPYETSGKRYDLIFVDGRNRSACLENAIGITDLVILHDSDRYKYKTAIDKYKFKKWTDDGNTVILTNSEEVYSKVKDLDL